MTGLAGWQLAALQALVVGAFGVLAVVAGSPLVRMVFTLVDRSSGARAAIEGGSAAAPALAPASTPETPVAHASTTLRGGAWIGRLERASIFAGLMMAWPEAIAICLAMKGLARYPELKAPSSGAAEAFIIGTFVSVLWACGCAGLAHWLIVLL